MEKLLLVDADVRNARMVDIGLRKSGFRVWLAGDGVDALAKVDALAPELIITDTQLPALDGRGLVSALRARRETAAIPVIFLVSPELTERGRRPEVEGDDWIRKPVVLRELISRIHAIEARRIWHQLSEEARPGVAQARVTGSTGRLAVVDLIRSFDVARRSGRVHLRSGLQEATMAFRDGRLVDAEFGRLRGEEAVYRALMLRDALFEIDFGVVSSEDIVRLSTDDLLAEGLNRLEETLEPRQEPAVKVSFRPASSPPAHADAGLRVRLSTSEPAPPDRAVVEEPMEARPEPVMRAVMRSPGVPPVHTDAVPRPSAATPLIRPAVQIAREAPLVDRTPVSPEPRTHDVAALAPPAPSEDTKRDAAVPAPSPMDVEWPAEPGTRPGAGGREAEVSEGTLPSMAQAPSLPTGSGRTDRPSRTVPPLTIHTSDEDAQALGVPRAISPMARNVVGASVLAAAAILVIAFFNSTHARQVREAEEAQHALATVAAAALMPSAAVPPSAAVAAPPEAPALAPHASASVVMDSPRPAESGTVVVAKASPPPNAGANPFVGGGRVPAPPVERGESALVARFEESGQSAAVLEAERALARGATSHAVELAQKAVAENPADADAWLTLGAAREASGDANSARLAYRSCVAQAHTVGLNHCRILAERQAGN